MATQVFQSQLGDNFYLFAVDANNNLYYPNAGPDAVLNKITKRSSTGNITEYTLDNQQVVSGLWIDTNSDTLYVFGFRIADNQDKKLRITLIPLSSDTTSPIEAVTEKTIPSKPISGRFAGKESAFYFIDSDGNCQELDRNENYSVARVFDTISFNPYFGSIAIDNDGKFYLSSGNDTTIARANADKSSINDSYIVIANDTVPYDIFINNNDLYVSYLSTIDSNTSVDIYNITTATKSASNVFSGLLVLVADMGFGTTQIYGLTNVSNAQIDPNALSTIYTVLTPAEAANNAATAANNAATAANNATTAANNATTAANNATTAANNAITAANNTPTNATVTAATNAATNATNAATAATTAATTATTAATAATNAATAATNAATAATTAATAATTAATNATTAATNATTAATNAAAAVAAAIASRYPCFKEDSKILTDKGYIMIQDLKKGDLVKTLKNGYKPIVLLGKRDIEHKCIEERVKDQLYKCDQSEYPEITEPLILTGCHSILVDKFTSDEQREHTIKINGDTYVTDKKYRLPAAADERAKVYEVPGTYTIYHVALEHENYYANYGIYANGLLVETCSKRYLTELSNMELL